MPNQAIATFGGLGVVPLWDTGRMDAVTLASGKSYQQGQVLGQVAGTGTAINEVQTLTVTGTPTGGSTGIYYGGQLVATIPFNATAAAAKALLEAFFGVGNIGVSGGPLPGTALVMTFQVDAGGKAQALMTTAAAYTGGATPAAAITRTTAGKPAGGYYDTYADTVIDPAKRVLRFPCTVDAFGNVVFGDTANLEGPPNRAAPAWFQGHFRISDLVGLDAAAVADLGKFTHGNAVTDANAILCITGAG
jgi:hypothetical protein